MDTDALVSSSIFCEWPSVSRLIEISFGFKALIVKISQSETSDSFLLPSVRFDSAFSIYCTLDLFFFIFGGKPLLLENFPVCDDYTVLDSKVGFDPDFDCFCDIGSFYENKSPVCFARTKTFFWSWAVESLFAVRLISTSGPLFSLSVSFVAISIETEISSAFFNVKSASDRSFFWIEIDDKPHTNRPLNACSRNSTNSQVPLNFLNSTRYWFTLSPFPCFLWWNLNDFLSILLVLQKSFLLVLQVMPNFWLGYMS